MTAPYYDDDLPSPAQGGPASLGPNADPVRSVWLRESEWSDLIAAVMYAADDHMEAIAERIREQALSPFGDESTW